MLAASCGFQDAPQGQKLLIHYGPAIAVKVGFDPDYKGDRNAPPVLKTASHIEALIDTGARESCIDSAVAQNLGLTIFDRRPVVGVTGVLETDFYLAQVHVPALRFTLHGWFAGVPLAACGFTHKAILGRSFLSYFKLSYDGQTGQVVISLES
jgi:hypothetical protein